MSHDASGLAHRPNRVLSQLPRYRQQALEVLFFRSDLNVKPVSILLQDTGFQRSQGNRQDQMQ